MSTTTLNLMALNEFNMILFSLCLPVVFRQRRINNSANAGSCRLQSLAVDWCVRNENYFLFFFGDVFCSIYHCNLALSCGKIIERNELHTHTMMWKHTTQELPVVTRTKQKSHQRNNRMRMVKKNVLFEIHAKWTTIYFVFLLFAERKETLTKEKTHESNQISHRNKLNELFHRRKRELHYSGIYIGHFSHFNSD